MFCYFYLRDPVLLELAESFPDHLVKVITSADAIKDVQPKYLFVDEETLKTLSFPRHNPLSSELSLLIRNFTKAELYKTFPEALNHIQHLFKLPEENSFLKNFVNGANATHLKLPQDQNSSVQKSHDQSPLFTKSIISALDQTLEISQTDKEGKIIYANALFLQKMGYTLSEIIGEKHSIFHSEIHSSSFYRDIYDLLKLNLSWSGEICNKDKQGQFHWYYMTILPIMNSKGIVENYIALRTDISDLKQLQSKNKELEIFSILGEFSSQLLHDIMNPISNIGLNLSMMDLLAEKGEVSSVKLNELSTKMKRSIEKIMNINHNMREVLLGLDDKYTPKEKKSLDKTIESAQENVHIKITDFAISLNTHVEDNLMLSHSNKIEQIIANLISNSCDAIKNEKENRWIKVSSLTEKDNLVISVTDSGSGISEDIANHMFDSLFSTKKSHGGTGLGLSICSKMANKLGGHIKYIKDSPHTRFDIILPLANVA